ncbi:DUF2933 domain-containing protein [Xanthobacter autotrophicus DSM 431]|uniref:DUF2933 domain-containing protein n=1 Tax=Xanthobacter nonsaccharivorans TaxID=3119912 RepID=UPI0037261B00
MHDDTGAQVQHREGWRSRGGIIAVGFLLAAAFLLLSEHRAHALGSLTFLLLQWPTLVTLAMFPILVWVHARLARQEAAAARAEFGSLRDDYASRVPAFLPRIGISSATAPRSGDGPHD